MGRQELAAHRLQPADASSSTCRPTTTCARPWKGYREIRARIAFTGRQAVVSIVPGADHIGEVQAERGHGAFRADHTFARSSNWGPMLCATGGGWSSAAERPTASSGRSMPGRERSCGSSHRFRRHRAAVVVRASACQSASPCSPVGASTPRMQNRLNAIRPGEFPKCRKGARGVGCSPWRTDGWDVLCDTPLDDQRYCHESTGAGGES
jgi:hypothetical protein